MSIKYFNSNTFFLAQNLPWHLLQHCDMQLFRYLNDGSISKTTTCLRYRSRNLIFSIPIILLDFLTNCTRYTIKIIVSFFPVQAMPVVLILNGWICHIKVMIFW